MKKHSSRRIRTATVPTMVALYVTPELETAERMALSSITDGWAGTEQFNILLDCADILLLAATEKKRMDVLSVVAFARSALENMRSRYDRTKRVGATGDEIKALHVLVDVSVDFWAGTSGSLFAAAYRALDKYRAYQREQVARKKAAA